MHMRFSIEVGPTYPAFEIEAEWTLDQVKAAAQEQRQHFDSRIPESSEWELVITNGENTARIPYTEETDATGTTVLESVLHLLQTNVQDMPWLLRALMQQKGHEEECRRRNAVTSMALGDIDLKKMSLEIDKKKDMLKVKAERKAMKDAAIREQAEIWMARGSGSALSPCSLHESRESREKTNPPSEHSRLLECSTESAPAKAAEVVAADVEAAKLAAHEAAHNLMIDMQIEAQVAQEMKAAIEDVAQDEEPEMSVRDVQATAAALPSSRAPPVVAVVAPLQVQLPEPWLQVATPPSERSTPIGLVDEDGELQDVDIADHTVSVRFGGSALYSELWLREAQVVPHSEVVSEVAAVSEIGTAGEVGIAGEVAAASEAAVASEVAAAGKGAATGEGADASEMEAASNMVAAVSEVAAASEVAVVSEVVAASSEVHTASEVVAAASEMAAASKLAAASEMAAASKLAAAGELVAASKLAAADEVATLHDCERNPIERGGPRNIGPRAEHASQLVEEKLATCKASPKGLPIATAAPSDPYQLALNGKLEEVCAAVRADPAVLQRPMSGGLFDSRTLLHCAAARGQEALTRALLELGADPSIADKRGMTAVALAEKQGHEAVVALLEAPPTLPPPTKRAHDEESVREEVREELSLKR